MIVGVMRVELYIHGATSLKEKRRNIRSIKDRLRKNFNVSVAEVENYDLWNRGSLGIALVGNDPAFVQESVDRIKEFLERNWPHLILEMESEMFRLACDDLV